MIPLQSTAALLDTADTDFVRDVLLGLSQPQKIGNSTPEEAVDLLGRFARLLGPDVDATQDPKQLM